MGTGLLNISVLAVSAPLCMNNDWNMETVAGFMRDPLVPLDIC